MFLFMVREFVTYATHSFLILDFSNHLLFSPFECHTLQKLSCVGDSYILNWLTDYSPWPSNPGKPPVTLD